MIQLLVHTLYYTPICSCFVLVKLLMSFEQHQIIYCKNKYWFIALQDLILCINELNHV